jgi:hypothetical protein
VTDLITLILCVSLLFLFLPSIIWFNRWRRFIKEKPIQNVTVYIMSCHLKLNLNHKRNHFSWATLFRSTAHWGAAVYWRAVYGLRANDNRERRKLRYPWAQTGVSWGQGGPTLRININTDESRFFWSGQNVVVIASFYFPLFHGTHFNSPQV